MHDLLHRLYKTKLTLLAVLLAVTGLGLLFLEHWAASQPPWSPLHDLPVADIGSALFTTGLIAVAWQYFAQEVADANTMRLFLAAITEKAPAIRDAVIHGFAFEAEDLARVASPETLDRISTNCLALQLGDRSLADDVYTNLKQQIVRARERRQDVDVSIDLSPWEQGPAIGDGSMFVATVRWQYRVSPATPAMRFSCVSSLDEYRELILDPASTGAWYFQPKAGLTGASEEAFRLAQFTVNGESRSIRRSSRKDAQTFTVKLGDIPPGDVTIAYTYRLLVQRHGHLLYLDIGKLIKGLKVEFRYGGCGIRYLNVRDTIAGAGQPRITHTPESVPAPAVEIDFDGWVLPKSGVAFIWVLDSEMG